jgi:Ig domain of plant-specific actin-binding protein
MLGVRFRHRFVAVATVAVASLLWAATALAAPPVNTSPPTITGTAAVGETLTAQNGTWDNVPTTFEYRWLRCNAAGDSCVGVPGATDRTYKVVGADVGHRLRVRVTAVNADGSTNARSAPTAIAQQPSAAPKNTERPTISGTARVGQTLTASTGSWTGNPTSFGFQWQRCDADGSNCSDIAGATSRTYTVRTADVGFRLRVQVTARTEKGTATASSGVSAIAVPAARTVNQRPTLRILSVRFLGARVYARFRVCDDSMKNLSIIQTDSRPGVLSYTRRFSTLVPPRPCGVYTRNWLPAPRFRGEGRYTITLRARDKSGLTSAPARRTFTLSV